MAKAFIGNKIQDINCRELRKEAKVCLLFYAVPFFGLASYRRMLKVKGVILHGGAGTRLRPLTHTGPKQLIPIANKPISQYVLEDLLNSGICEVAIVLGETHPHKVEEYFSNGKSFGAKIKYLYQGEPKGIAHAVSLCKEYIGNDDFVVYLGDNLLKGGIGNYVQNFRKSDCDAMILLCEVRDPQRFGVAEFNKDKKLIRLIEKPKDPPSRYALTGIYFFTPVIFDAITRLKPSSRSELEITDAIQTLLDEGFSVGYDFVQGWWKDTGLPEDIMEANRLILDDIQTEIRGKIQDEKSLQGRVRIGENTVIKKGAIIRGPAAIGKNVAVENEVYIGPYTSIGDNVVLKRAEIENSIIMNDCRINIEGRIVDSLVGAYTEIFSKNSGKPHGSKFILGERSFVQL